MISPINLERSDDTLNGHSNISFNTGVSVFTKMLVYILVG
jgi:hypothetical protein